MEQEKEKILHLAMEALTDIEVILSEVKPADNEDAFKLGQIQGLVSALKTYSVLL